MVDIHYAGETVRLKAIIKNADTTANTDLEDVTVTIYDRWRNIIHGPISDNIQHIGTGIYEYVYTLPTQYDLIVQEWKGLYEGYPEIRRENIEIVWATTPA